MRAVLEGFGQFIKGRAGLYGRDVGARDHHLFHALTAHGDNVLNQRPFYRRGAYVRDVFI